MKEKMKSPVVWVSVIAQLTLIFSIFNTNFSENFKIISTSIVEILTLIGILNNPNKRDGF